MKSRPEILFQVLSSSMYILCLFSWMASRVQIGELSWTLSFWWEFLRDISLVCPPSPYLQAAESTSSHSASLSALIVGISYPIQVAFTCLISISSLFFSQKKKAFQSFSKTVIAEIAGNSRETPLPCLPLHSQNQSMRDICRLFLLIISKRLFLSSHKPNIKIQIYSDSCQCNNTFPSALMQTF